MPGDGYEVDPQVLRVTGDGFVDVADAVHATASELSGQSDALGGANMGFSTRDALAELERAWEEATDDSGKRIAVAGGLLHDSAEEYAHREDEAARALTGLG